MTTKETLKRARDLIADPNRWCQGMLRDGDRVCALGAISEVAGFATVREGWWQRVPAVRALAGVLPRTEENDARRVSCYNDGQPHHCVIAAFDAAIEKCES